jgi:hypothetical protein
VKLGITARIDQVMRQVFEGRGLSVTANGAGGVPGAERQQSRLARFLAVHKPARPSGGQPE